MNFVRTIVLYQLDASARKIAVKMSEASRTSLKVLLTVVFGLFSLPMLIFGGYFLVCWFRIHTSDVYYVAFSYLTAGLIWIGIGILSFLATLYGAWRRSFYGLLFLFPLFLGLGAMVIIPDSRPETFRSMVADSNYFSDANSFLRVWYEGHHKFPASQSEFKEAMAQGPAAWQYRVPAQPESRYKQGGRLLPYELVIVNNATGPRVTDISHRPGVIYYCVSRDQQEFWVTMTSLNSDVASAAVIKRVADRPELAYWMAHAAGSDYPAKKY